MIVPKEQMKFINQLSFPILIQKESRDQTEEWFEEPLKDVIAEMATMSQGLQPYKEQLTLFYQHPMFYQALVRSEDVYTFERWSDYEMYLQSLSDDALKERFVRALLETDDEVEEVQDSDVAELAGNQFALLDRLNQMPLEDAVRWTYFNAVNAPAKVVDDFCAVHRDISPVFEAVYAMYEGQLLQEVELFRERLERQPSFLQEAFDGLESVTDLPLDSDRLVVIPHLLLSDFMSFTLADSEYLLLGGKFVECIDLLVAYKNNQQQERISIFKNLGDPTRYEIIRLIASGVKSVKQIAQTLNITSATVTYHINQMMISNLVLQNWNKKETTNPINREMLDRAIDGLMGDLHFKL